LLKRFGGVTDPTTAERASRACLLLPLGGDDLAKTARLADVAVSAGPDHEYYTAFAFAKGLAEYRQERLPQALEWLTKALNRPKWKGMVTPARLVQALARHRAGQVEEARRTLTAEVGSSNWSSPNDHNLWIMHILRREAEALIMPTVGSFLKGEYEPKDNAERLELIKYCLFQPRYVWGTRLYADVFATEPKLAESGPHRYDAACCAARAADTRDKSAAKLEPLERGRWRAQAITWLTAELAAHQKRMETGKAQARAAVRKTLEMWQRDSDLASIRDAVAIAELASEEQDTCRRLWADVEALLKKAKEK
jgi:hypothetical protein